MRGNLSTLITEDRRHGKKFVFVMILSGIHHITFVISNVFRYNSQFRIKKYRSAHELLIVELYALRGMS